MVRLSQLVTFQPCFPSRDSCDSQLCRIIHHIRLIWARFHSLNRNKLKLCSVNHRAGYFSNVACDWLSIVWAYSKQGTANEPWWRCLRSTVPCHNYHSDFRPSVSRLQRLNSWTQYLDLMLWLAIWKLSMSLIHGRPQDTTTSNIHLERIAASRTGNWSGYICGF